jgi:hypothetical protein
MNAEASLAANIQIMQFTTSYWTSRCLHVVAELGIADLIGDQPQSTEALAKASGTQPNALYRVLRLLASVGIFEWKHEPPWLFAGLRPNARPASVLECLW